jgi:hypothetical protein
MQYLRFLNSASPEANYPELLAYRGPVSGYRVNSGMVDGGVTVNPGGLANAATGTVTPNRDIMPGLAKVADAPNADVMFRLSASGQRTLKDSTSTGRLQAAE